MLNTLKEIEQSTATTLVQELLLSWGKIMWFVSYAELIRNTKPDLEMLKTAATTTTMIFNNISILYPPTPLQKKKKKCYFLF